MHYSYKRYHQQQPHFLQKKCSESEHFFCRSPRHSGDIRTVEPTAAGPSIYINTESYKDKSPLDLSQSLTAHVTAIGAIGGSITGNVTAMVQEMEILDAAKKIAYAAMNDPFRVVAPTMPAAIRTYPVNSAGNTRGVGLPTAALRMGEKGARDMGSSTNRINRISNPHPKPSLRPTRDLDNAARALYEDFRRRLWLYHTCGSTHRYPPFCNATLFKHAWLVDRDLGHLAAHQHGIVTTGTASTDSAGATDCISDNIDMDATDGLALFADSTSLVRYLWHLRLSGALSGLGTLDPFTRNYFQGYGRSDTIRSSISSSYIGRSSICGSTGGGGRASCGVQEEGDVVRRVPCSSAAVIRRLHKVAYSSAGGSATSTAREGMIERGDKKRLRTYERRLRKRANTVLTTLRMSDFEKLWKQNGGEQQIAPSTRENTAEKGDTTGELGNEVVGKQEEEKTEGGRQGRKEKSKASVFYRSPLATRSISDGISGIGGSATHSKGQKSQDHNYGLGKVFGKLKRPFGKEALAAERKAKAVQQAEKVDAIRRKLKEIADLPENTRTETLDLKFFRTILE